MQHTKPQKTKNKKSSPRLPWQQGKFNRRLNLNVVLPYQFLLLCRLWDLAPEDLIVDFLNNLSHSSWKREGRENVKQKLVEYVQLSGYGKSFYSEKDTLQIFKELDAIGMLFPGAADDDVLNKYAAFRDAYQDHWFNKWYYKTRRKNLSTNI